MKKVDVTNLLKGVRSTLSKRSPEILTGIGIAGMITTTVLAVKATPKALALIDEAEENKKEQQEDFTKVDVVKAAWKPYIPAMVTGVASVACLIGANSVHLKRNAALATAYQLSTTAFNDYREKVVETIGEKKEKTVRDKVAKEKMENNPASNAPIIITGGGNTLFYDSHSDRYFRSDIYKVKNAVLNLNERMINGSEMYISLNEFYDEIGLKHTGLGNSIGWRIDKGKIDVRYGSMLTDENEPCVVIDHLMPPEYDYNTLY